MAKINEFFNELNRKIRNAKTRKTLHLLIKRGKLFVRKINRNPDLSNTTKKRAKIALNKSIKLAKQRLSSKI